MHVRLGNLCAHWAAKWKRCDNDSAPISSMTSRSKPDSVTAKRKPAVRAAAWASLRPSLWVPQVLFSRGWAECHGAKKVFALHGLRPVHFWARASTLHCLLLRMFLSAWEAKYLTNTSSLIVQAGCQPRNPSSWTSKWHTSPSVCKAFLRRWRAIVSARCCWGRSLSCACFQQSVSRPCGLALQPRSSSLFKWGEGTTSAKGIPQVRLCSLQFPSMARMSCLSPAACIWAKRLEDMSRCGKSGKNELGNLENCYRIKWTLLSVAQSYAFWGKFLSGRQQQEIQIDQAWQTWGVHTKSNWLQWASRPCRSRHARAASWTRQRQLPQLDGRGSPEANLLGADGGCGIEQQHSAVEAKCLHLENWPCEGTFCTASVGAKILLNQF